MLEATHRRTYLGPSRRATEPAVTASLRLTDPAEFDSAAARLTQWCAEWFVRPQTETGDAAVAAADFVANWGRDMLNEGGATILEAGAARVDFEAVLHIGYHLADATMAAIELCCDLLVQHRNLDADSVAERLARFWADWRHSQPDLQARLLIAHARRTNLPWSRITRGGRLWHYGWGAKGTAMFEAMPIADSALGVQWARDKEYSKLIFRDLGAPVAPGVLVRREEELQQVAETIGFPCVVKPVDGGKAIGITTHIRTFDHLRAAYRVAAPQSLIGVIVERCIEGASVRIVVIRGRFRWAIRRNHPTVVGDGHSTIERLVATLNASRAAVAGHTSVGRVPDDDEFRSALRDQGLGLTDIPEAGRAVRLRNIPLSSTGAHYDDVTAALHPDTRDTAEAIARYFGIQSCGLDFITEDPAQSCHREGAFTEINATPNLWVPVVGGVSADDVGAVALDGLARIPSLLVVAATESRDHIRSRLPAVNTLGWAIGPLAGLGSATLSGRHPSVHQSAEVVLHNPKSRAVVVVATPDEIRDCGLPAGWFDHAIVVSGCGLDEQWTSVVQRRAGSCETADLSRVDQAIAALGRA